MKARIGVMSIGQLFILLLLDHSNVALAIQEEGLITSPALNTAAAQTAGSPLITSAPALPRDALFRRQDVNCDSSVSSASSVASQSASAAIQRATQSAQQSIDAASRSITQAQQSAAQSASQAIQKAQQSASQQIQAASQSANQAVSSANSVVSSVQSSASQAIASASSAEQSASSAVVQAGAAVAAATGSAAAAGSSFLVAAAKATEGAQASASAISAAAQAQVDAEGKQVTASQVAAVSATQAAVAIVGSVIASSLLSILIYFLVARHRKRAAAKASRDGDNFQYRNAQDPPEKAPVMAVNEEKRPETPVEKKAPETKAPAEKFSLFQSLESPKKPLRSSVMKRTSLLWNPRKPPPAPSLRGPSLRSWIRTQQVSPFIVRNTPMHRQDSVKSVTRKPVASEEVSIVSIVSVEGGTVKLTGGDGPRKEAEETKSMENVRWTDESVHSREGLKALKSPEEGSSAGMTNLSQATTDVAAPIPLIPRPGTAEWMRSPPPRNSLFSSTQAQNGPGNMGKRTVSGLPQNPRMGLPNRPGPAGRGNFFGRYDMEIQGVYEERMGLRSARISRDSNLSREGSLNKRSETPGKAL